MKAKKSLGQNFLIDNNVINNIVSLIDAKENDLIVEIGPGRGALTSKLAKLSCNTVCIELDTDMHKYLDNIKGINVIYEDILNVDLKSIVNKYNYDRLFVVGNLPYYITTPIMEKMIKDDIYPDKMIYMVQDEVAKRLSSLPRSKEYGYMTVFLREFYNSNYEFYVDKLAFNPVPKVNSAIISFEKNDNYSYDFEFDKFLKLCFLHKRKTLKNNLNDYKEDVDKFIEINNLLPSLRAEELGNVEFHELYELIFKK